MHTRIFILLTLVLLPAISNAQPKGIAAGIYAVKGEEYIPLDYTYGGSVTCPVVALSPGERPVYYRYKGMTSKVEGSDSFLYVVDCNNKIVYDPFNKYMTAKDLGILPMLVNPELQIREYYLNLYDEIPEMDSMPELDYEWEKLDKSTYLLKVHDIPPGEYGIAFCQGRFGAYDYTRIYCFTIPER